MIITVILLCYLFNFNCFFTYFFFVCFFFFNDTATTEIYTLSLHDALPIAAVLEMPGGPSGAPGSFITGGGRSEEHTSELQSPYDLVCSILLEKKKKKINYTIYIKKKNNKKTKINYS